MYKTEVPSVAAVSNEPLVPSLAPSQRARFQFAAPLPAPFRVPLALRQQLDDDESDIDMLPPRAVAAGVHLDLSDEELAPPPRQRLRRGRRQFIEE